MRSYGNPPYRPVCREDGEIRYYVSDHIPDHNSPAWKRAHDEIIAEQRARARDRLPMIV